MLKLFALGVLGYVGYRYLAHGAAERPSGLATSPVAGGPLSAHAAVQADPDHPPVDDPYADKGP